jgi:hexosaminidase
MDVQQIVAGNATPEVWRDARAQLIRWRDNDAKLQPILPRSSLTADLAPVSAKLAKTATIGLRALDALHSKSPLSSATRQQDMEFLQRAAKPQAVVIDVVVPSVETLLQAAPAQ